MAKGNDGNYLQHCIEIKAAKRLVQYDTKKRRLHIALTHGMAPFEPFEDIDKPSNNACHLLYEALCEASREPARPGERLIVEAYRKTRASEKYYPNTAELLREVLGESNLSGGITECDCKKYKELKDRLSSSEWSDSNVDVACSSWRKQLGPEGILSCPKDLDKPWMFSMDPFSFSENDCKIDEKSKKLHPSDVDLLEDTLRQYVNSEKPGFASLFVYAMEDKMTRCFWNFVDDLKARLGIKSCSYWIDHSYGTRNLASILYSFSHPPIERPNKPSESCRVNLRKAN